MNEQPLSFGPGNGLLGIMTQPPAPNSGLPTVILLNAGLLHRVGPNRLHVELARRLAGLGYPCLRFDMSGVGDSELTAGGLLDIERSVADVVLAMDAMAEAAGSTRYVLMGLCTGAFNAFRAALIDDRVAGCVMLDGYSYPTRRSQVRHYRSRVLELDRWQGWISRKLGRSSGARSDSSSDLIVFENEVVPKERFRDEMASILDRGVALLMIYTGLGPLSFNYARQMHDAFPELEFDRTATVRYYPQADHTFRLPGNRNTLFSDVEQWLQTEFSSGHVGSRDGGRT